MHTVTTTVVTETPAVVVNALVNQGDQIRAAIRDASDADELQRAVRLLDFATVLWVACGFNYKVRELKNSIKTKATDLAAEEETFLSKERKNSKVRRITEKNITDLYAIAEYVS